VDGSKFVATFSPLHREALSWSGRLAKFFCFLIFLTLALAAAPQALAQSQPVPSVSPDAPFAFSDFDGDRRPDLAVVQAGRSDLSLTDYWVQFHLTAVGLHSIRVVAPTGGLQIAARDVNGDHVPDLVLTTSWRKLPVAILLNDGHGSFSLADPAAYPEAFRGSKTSWIGSASPELDRFGVPSQSPTGACPSTARLPYLGSPVRATRPSDGRFPLARGLIPHLGRAPPPEFLVT
jgi:hypothetical protein